MKRAPRGIAAAETALSERDTTMARLIAAHGPCTLRAGRGDHFAALVESIVYQQLSGKAAETIHARLVARLASSVTPESIAAAPERALREAGLSAAKTASIKDLAGKVASGLLPLDDVRALSDEELIERLIAVRGVGRWTAQMFLMFQLRRLDVWPTGDYGVRKGYAVAYEMSDLPKPSDLEAFGDRFRPYRSVAAWYCWRAVDTVTQAGRS